MKHTKNQKQAVSTLLSAVIPLVKDGVCDINDEYVLPILLNADKTALYHHLKDTHFIDFIIVLQKASSDTSNYMYYIREGKSNVDKYPCRLYLNENERVEFQDKLNVCKEKMTKHGYHGYDIEKHVFACCPELLLDIKGVEFLENLSHVVADGVSYSTHCTLVPILEIGDFFTSEHPVAQQACLLDEKYQNPLYCVQNIMRQVQNCLLLSDKRIKKYADCFATPCVLLDCSDKILKFLLAKIPHKMYFKGKFDWRDDLIWIIIKMLFTDKQYKEVLRYSEALECGSNWNVIVRESTGKTELIDVQAIPKNDCRYSDPLGVCAHSVFRDYVHFMISSKLVSDGHTVDEMPVLSAQHFNYFALSEQLEKEFPVLAEMFSFAAEVMLSSQYRDERKGKLKV